MPDCLNLDDKKGTNNHHPDRFMCRFRLAVETHEDCYDRDDDAGHPRSRKPFEKVGAHNDASELNSHKDQVLPLDKQLEPANQ
jgi:hypothetical protein